MLNKYLLAPIVLALGGWLFAPDAALAQHGHTTGGHTGGGHVSGYHGGGGGYHGGGSGYGGRGYGGRGYGYGGRGYGGYGGGYGYGGYGGWGYGGFPWWGGAYWDGGYPYYGGSYGGDTYVYPNNYTTYVEPDATYAQPTQQVSDNTAGIRVIVPDPNARVWFDGNATTQTGTDRLFITPPLAAGEHSYRIRATWTQNGREMTQERTVPIMAGRLSIADFTRPQSEPLPTPTTAK